MAGLRLIRDWRAALGGFLFFLAMTFFASGVSIAAMSPAQMRLQHASDVQKAQELVKEFDRMVKAGASQHELSRQALKISTDYQAKLLLKNDGNFKSLGHRYHDLMKGPKGNGGVLSDVLAETQKRLRAMNKYPDSVIDDLTLIQNEASIAQKKPPMDVDLGLKVDPNTAAGKKLSRQYMKDLGGPGGVGTYHDDLKKALEGAYEHVADSKYKVKVDSGKAFLEGTTPWHVEAYLDAEVLKQGGLPQKGLIEQTVSVSTHKNNHFLKEAMEGKISWGSAYQEAARGTLKDMEKVDSVFAEVRRQTGAKFPRLSDEQQELRRLLKKMTSPGADPIAVAEEVKRLTRGKNVIQACNGLVETMESAVKFAPPAKILKAKFYRKYLSSKDLRKALDALIADRFSDLPKTAQLLDRKLAKVAGLHMLSMEKLSTQQFLAKLQKSIGDMQFDSADELVDEIFKRIHTAPDSEMAVLFGEQSTKELEKVRKLTDPSVKHKIAARYKGKFMIWQIDEKTQRVLLGDGGIKTLAFDGIIGVATAMHQTAGILDDPSLSESDRNLKIANAWVTGLPMVGDFAMAIIDGIDAYYEGDRGKAIQSGVFLVIGVAYAVPGFQIPALVAGLGMTAWQLGGSAWDVSKDKAVIWAWVDSGKWDPNRGRLLGLMDSKGQIRPVAPPEKAFEKLMEQGEIGYHTGLKGVTISKSIYEFMDRTLMANNKNVEAMKTAIHNLYPGFVVDDYLHEHLNVGRSALAAIVRSKGGNVRRDVGLALYVKLKKDIYDKAALEAIKKLKLEAEAEYQAKYMVGDAAQAFRDLEDLAQKLRLPLVEHVWEIYESFVKWATEKVKSPWTRHSLPRRHVELAKKYVRGYTRIDKSLDTVRETIRKAGLKPPDKFHLTGWLDIDSKRVDGLVQAYRNALVEAKKDVEIIHAKAAGLTSWRFDPKNPCDQNLFLKLAKLKVIMVHSRDMMLLMEEWSGKKSAADKSRDEKLQNAIDQVDNAPQPLWALPLTTWQALSSAYENAYAWAHVTWEGSQVLLTARDTIAKRIEDKKKEYEDAKAAGLEEMAKCLANLTVHLRYKSEDGTENPIKGGRVLLKGQGVSILLNEMKGGDYITGIPKAGSYTLRASAKGFKAQDGSGEAVVVLTVPPVPVGGAPQPMEETIYLAAPSPPQLSLEFKKATQSDPPRLLITVKAQDVDLDPQTVSASLDGTPIKLDAGAAAAGKDLQFEYKFDKPQKPGKRKLSLKISDINKIEYSLNGEFTYRIALLLVGHVLSDKGGAPEDGKATSEETVKIGLKLKSLEPWPLQGLTVKCPADDVRLKPVAENTWKLASLPSRAETATNMLEFKVGQIPAKAETVRLDLKAALAGVSLEEPLELSVTVHPLLTLELELVLPVDDAKQSGTPNNGDGKASQGESLTLTLRVKNTDNQKSLPYEIKLSCSSPQLSLGNNQLQGAPLAGMASQDFKLPATVGVGYKKPFTVKILAQVTPQGQAKGRSFELPLELVLAPLDIKLVDIKVEDPSSGSLINRNNANGTLGSGEYGYLTVRLVNQGPDIQEAYVDLSGPRFGGLTIGKPQAGSLPMPSQQPVEARFTIDLPVDYLKNQLPLTVKVKDGQSGRSWQGEKILPFEPKSDFSSKLTLMGANGEAKPEEIIAGTSLPYELELVNNSKGNQQGLSLGLEYTSVSIVPNLWTGQDYPSGAKQVYKGTLKIPADIKGDGFWVRLSLRNASGTAYVHKNRFTFKLGMRPTRVKIKPIAPPTGSSAWKLAISVETKDGSPVDEGSIKLTAASGNLSADQAALAQGKAEITWTPPPGQTGKTEVEVSYLGDEPDPAKPDRKYQASSAKIKLPPDASPTKVVVKPRPPQGRNAPYTILVKVVEQAGKMVGQGSLEVSCDIGQFSGGGLGPKGGTLKIEGKEIALSWKAPADRKAKGSALFSYLGDEADPARPDQKYQPSQKSIKLPPQALTPVSLSVTPVLIDKDKRIWRLDVSLLDDRLRGVPGAKVVFTANGGSFGESGSALRVEQTLKGGKYEKGWRETDDQQHTITVTYPGDQSGPGGENKRYEPAEAKVTLPPEMIARSTIFVVDASGSMSGGKLGSAKAAVRSALGGYSPDQGQEEWALIVFAGCGNIRVYHPFTTNPYAIIGKLTFRAGGGTPIAASLGRAGAYMRRAARGKVGRIILLSDGGETCKGKPVEAAKGVRRSVRTMNLGGGRP